jgi:hypothetical protein
MSAFDELFAISKITREIAEALSNTSLNAEFAKHPEVVKALNRMASDAKLVKEFASNLIPPN